MKISGRKHWLWRAFDQYVVVLYETLHQKRDKWAAKRLLRNLTERLGFVPKRIIIDKIRSHGAAKREIAQDLMHW